MNLNAIKQRLATMQQRGGSGQKNNKLAENIWKPTVGKHQVRIVPAKWDKENPFKEMFFHYGISKYPMSSLINYGEKDPIVEFSQVLSKQQPYDPENYKKAKKLEPKMRVFAPVIVRGQEDKGVRLWEFGKEVYMELLAIAEDEDVGDYSDTLQGRDLTVDTVGPDQSGRQFNKTTVRVKAKITPLSEDASKIKTWLTVQPDPLEIFTRNTYEELKQALVEFLDEGTEEEEDEVEETEEEETPVKAEEKKPAGKKYTLNTKKKEADIDKEFDELFEEE